MHTIYTGPRIRIRPFRSLEEGCKIVRQMHLILTPSWGPMWFPLPEEDKKWNESGWVSSEHTDLAIEEPASGQVIGYLMLTPPQEFRLDSWISTFITPEFQRRGYGVEAKQLGLCHIFENYPAHRVGAVTLSNHAAARRGLDLAGFTHEGSFHGTFISGGRRVDKVFYVITREQWEQQPMCGLVRRG
jgi:RimJ/RimL family protein N-acetyltransferase